MYGIQVDAVYHLLVHNKLLLAWKTGMGKSTVFHVASVMRRGVILMVWPLLALMTDQFRKARQLKSPFGRIFCYNIDQIKGAQQINNLVCDLCSLGKDTTDTYFIFASPQTIPKYSQVLGVLMRRDMIRLIAFDEYHFISVYGRGFRPEVNNLKHRLFLPYLSVSI